MVEAAALDILGLAPGPLTRAAGDVGGSHRPESITAGTQVAGELPFLLLVGAGRAGHALFRLAVVIRSL